MGRYQKLLQHVLMKKGDANVPFDGLCQLLCRFEMIIYWSKEDHAYIVEVPELPGCMADGRTYQEAVSNAEIIIAEWIKTAEDLGRPIPKPRGKLMYA